ncbi:MAG: efflux transporter, family, subunit [Candidatus Solibacter sp.]|nr:efflux transporter, family, subunit [Candidatus Solibacter sp.]
MKKLLLVLLLAGLAAVIVWGVLRKNEPPKVAFARAKRQTLVSTLPTNGKVEPFAWQPVRAETSGVVSRVFVEDGQTVPAGALMATISDPTLQGEIEAAQAKVGEARANLNALEAGGKPAEFTEIENNLARARFDLAQAKKTAASLERLVEQHAATQQELDAAREKVQQYELEIAGLDKRRGSLVAPHDVAAARARLADAESAVRLAQQRGALSAVHAPMAGTVYGREIRQGSYVNAGDLIANIGRMDQLRVRVYVDEPELGRVAEGQPVTITWDALPGRQWKGKVEKTPVAIQALGSRQVGEVICAIDNEGRVLIPGTNVNAEIRTAVVDNALVIPKETLRHDAHGDYVFALKGDTIERRAVKKGASSITQVQIVEGLSDSDAIALPADIPLKAGDHVSATM